MAWDRPEVHGTRPCTLGGHREGGAPKDDLKSKTPSKGKKQKAKRKWIRKESPPSLFKNGRRGKPYSRKDTHALK